MGLTEQEFALLKQNQALANPATAANVATKAQAQPRTGYRSKTEERYAAHLDLMVAAREIRDWKYEPVTLKLAVGVRYTPDFIVRKFNGTPEGALVFQEIKGRKGDAYWSMPVSKVKVRMAATVFPFWRFEIVWPGLRLGTWASMLVPSGKLEAR